MLKMKKVFIVLSFILNIAFIIFFFYLVQQRGGIPFLIEQFADEVREDRYKSKPDWYFMNSGNWEAMRSLYEILPNDTGEIIFVGNSITYGCQWAELFSNPRVKNRGINGDNTEGVLERLAEITESDPSKIFIEIGTNDLLLGMKISEICTNYQEIIERIESASPGTTIYIQSLLPVNSDRIRNNDSIKVLNHRLAELALAKGTEYINLFDKFTDLKGNLDMRLSEDGLHLNGAGYQVWRDVIKDFINEP